MPKQTVHDQLLHDYVLSMLIHEVLTPPEHQTLQRCLESTELDVQIILMILLAWYPNGQTHVPKSGNMHLAWEYSQSIEHYHCFVDLLRVTLMVFDTILTLIEDHPVFQNSSNNSQAPVEQQLATTLYRMGRMADVADVALWAGVSEGTVENYTNRCFEAIEALHPLFVRRLTTEEKEIEKQWMDQQVGFHGTWREGWVMYDGTIIMLYEKPGLNGDAYYTRKGNYGLNAQIGNTPSNLRIVDYSHGMTGSAHDAAAFEHTTAAKYPDWFFEGEEFAWADSTYMVNERTIPVHKQPASLDPLNTTFDKLVAHLRIWSEHCMGALKGCFPFLRCLHVEINMKRQHDLACRWITIAIILHNLVIDVAGSASGAEFLPAHGAAQELADRGQDDEPVIVAQGDAERKRRQLVAELAAYQEM